MKSITFLIFNKNGEINQTSTKCTIFSPENFPEYKHYKRYENYIILYNVEVNSKNITVFYFTSDRYTSDIALLKINNDKIKNLTYNMYVKEISKIKIEPNDYCSESDTEIEDITPFTF